MATILHRVKAYLYVNPLTPRPDDYMARVSSERSLGIPDICESAVSRGGADISSASMQHGVSLFLKEMAYLLCDGYSVNTGYFIASPLIKGNFNSPDESFDPSKHSIHFQFNQGEVLRKERYSIEVEIVGLAGNSRSISKVTDIKSGSVNDLLTPRHNLKINGHKIKVAGDHADTGVYFVNQATEESTRVDPSDLVINNPSGLIIVIPDLASGTYQIQIVTQFSKPSLLKKPRTIILNKLLTVQ